MSALLYRRMLVLLAAALAAAFPGYAGETAGAAQGAPSAESSPSASDYLGREEVVSFLKGVSKEHGIPLDWLCAEIAVARYSPAAERYSTPRPNANPKTSVNKNFRLYESRLISEERIVRGVRFIEDNADVFDRVERSTGVPRYIIAAVIGIETVYGKNKGRYRVLDSLMTLSFDYTRRAAFYRRELASFLDFCWKEQISPVTVLGSYAGAMGYGQFMPSSLDRFGTDGDGDHRIDIIDNEADAIASVAAFLKAHGWERGIEPLYPAEASRSIFEATGSGGIEAHTDVRALLAAGVKPLGTFGLADSEPVLLVDLPRVSSDGSRSTDFYIGTRNFAAILRYNRTYFYAAAVTFLADRIREREAAARTQ